MTYLDIFAQAALFIGSQLPEPHTMGVRDSIGPSIIDLRSHHDLVDSWSRPRRPSGLAADRRASTMNIPIHLALVGIVSAMLAEPAIANSTIITVVPSYPATPYGTQAPATPYTTPTFTIYPPGSTKLPPQFTNPAANTYPSGAQTCVAPPYTCPASAPNTPGDACTCPTKGGGDLAGVVH